MNSFEFEHDGDCMRFIDYGDRVKRERIYVDPKSGKRSWIIEYSIDGRDVPGIRALLANRADYDAECAQFNDGVEAAKAGLPDTAKPEYENDRDSWHQGWCWYHYERIAKFAELAALYREAMDVARENSKHCTTHHYWCCDECGHARDFYIEDGVKIYDFEGDGCDNPDCNGVYGPLTPAGSFTELRTKLDSLDARAKQLGVEG